MGAPLYAEFDAAFGSTLNQRSAANPLGDRPGRFGSDRPRSQLLRPAELEVVHDPPPGGCASNCAAVAGQCARCTPGCWQLRCCRCPPGCW
ncbi:hypothetical protein GXW82_15400 [Streptacidiphilus sp. 4-A2]|nr:hypothetical protein [Streptacidiphilus sp. 4-A2]